MAFDASWWEEHYRSAEGEGHHGPGPWLADEVGGLTPGTALDAGCGTGGAAIWLAQQGWTVTAVDVSGTAVERARARAAEQSPEVTLRLTWLVADLSTWEPTNPFDLVVTQYVHPDTGFEVFVGRLAECVAPGGTLFVAGHDHADSHSAAQAPQDASIDAQAVAGVLDPEEWQVVTAETRAGRDVVVNARRTA
ncbi:MAG: class I SAM-dependent methyltransferase [Nocardioides sp.]